MKENEAIVELTAAGGVMHRKEAGGAQVLLIYRNGVWDLPKGKKEADESIEACARREVAEETGVALPLIEAFLMETWHQYKQAGKQYGKTTHWFIMQGTLKDKLTPQHEEGIEAVQWVALEEAIERVGYSNLVKVLQQFRKKYNEGKLGKG